MPQSKTQKRKLNKKSKPIGMLYPDPSHKQGHTQTQTKGWWKTYQSNGEQKKKTNQKQQQKNRSCNFRL